MLCVSSGCSSSPSGNNGTTGDGEDEAFVASTKSFCGGCHVMPQPESFPKEAWHDEVQRGFDFYYDSNRKDLEPPDLQKVVKYFRRRAPDQLLLPDIENSEESLNVTFSKATIKASHADQPAAISHVRQIENFPGFGAGLLACDMQNGNVLFVDPLKSETRIETIFETKNPAHIQPADLDGDGELDFVVADLGSFAPEDHDKGKVFWFRRTDAGWKKEILIDGIGRVASVTPGDFSGDGKEDLVVAEFGWHKTGGIWLLRNVKSETDVPKFERKQLDARPGTIHVPNCDLNGDGRLDFVAVISQEYESIVAFLSNRTGSLEPAVIWEAHDPSYGSSGIELVDLDQDGDLDVLYTNGDTFDSFYIKPFHSVQWLENRGEYPFEHHHLTKMPGVHRALAGDVDGDKDLDVIAVALLPARSVNENPDATFDSVILLEQTSPGTFARFALEQKPPRHATFEMGDFDGDDDIDFAVGGFLDPGQADQPWLTIWWNETN